MGTHPPPGFGAGGVGQRIEEAIELIEMELRHAAAYVNDAVIPQVRAESILALRNVGNSLRNFADRLEQKQEAQRQEAQRQEARRQEAHRQQTRTQTPPDPSKESQR